MTFGCLEPRPESGSLHKGCYEALIGREIPCRRRLAWRCMIWRLLILAFPYRNYIHQILHQGRKGLNMSHILVWTVSMEVDVSMRWTVDVGRRERSS